MKDVDQIDQRIILFRQLDRWMTLTEVASALSLQGSRDAAGRVVDFAWARANSHSGS
jgi:hypothetical protein